jgi:hypothetical protein
MALRALHRPLEFLVYPLANGRGQQGDFYWENRSFGLAARPRPQLIAFAILP